MTFYQRYKNIPWYGSFSLLPALSPLMLLAGINAATLMFSVVGCLVAIVMVCTVFYIYRASNAHVHTEAILSAVTERQVARKSALLIWGYMRRHGHDLSVDILHIIYRYFLYRASTFDFTNARLADGLHLDRQLIYYSPTAIWQVSLFNEGDALFHGPPPSIRLEDTSIKKVWCRVDERIAATHIFFLGEDKKLYVSGSGPATFAPGSTSNYLTETFEKIPLSDRWARNKIDTLKVIMGACYTLILTTEGIIYFSGRFKLGSLNMFSPSFKKLFFSKRTHVKDFCYAVYAPLSIGTMRHTGLFGCIGYDNSQKKEQLYVADGRISGNFNVVEDYANKNIISEGLHGTSQMLLIVGNQGKNLYIYKAGSNQLTDIPLLDGDRVQRVLTAPNQAMVVIVHHPNKKSKVYQLIAGTIQLKLIQQFQKKVADATIQINRFIDSDYNIHNTYSLAAYDNDGRLLCVHHLEELPSTQKETIASDVHDGIDVHLKISKETLLNEQCCLWLIAPDKAFREDSRKQQQFHP